MKPELEDFLRQHLSWPEHLSGKERTRFLMLALCGEVGELANMIKKDWRGDDLDQASDIREEMADIGNYLFMLAMHMGIDLEEEMLIKLMKVHQRFLGRTGKC